ncbi:hypothetical protein [Paraferrimonas sp. SM1919]|uniref:hypothetical protein n=1 Tax=Paraferrimonas sp. SM1919 TaxID=2662263 RepID=UPI0013D7255C|nr:hypothetical protein [Paraferrimonas sp. SM1919]
MIASLCICTLLWFSFLARLPQLPAPWQGIDALAFCIKKYSKLALGISQLIGLFILIMGYQFIIDIMAFPWMLELYILALALQNEDKFKLQFISSSFLFLVFGSSVLFSWLLLKHINQQKQHGWSHTLTQIIEFIPFVIWFIFVTPKTAIRELIHYPHWQLNTPRILVETVAQQAQKPYIMQKIVIWLAIVTLALLMTY